MGLLAVDGACSCGHPLKWKQRKPLITFTMAKVNCPKCGSRFLCTLSRDPSGQQRELIHHMECLEISGQRNPESARLAERREVAIPVEMYDELNDLGLIKDGN